MLLRKNYVLKTSIKRFASRSIFGEAPNHTDIIEFWNFLLQLKIQEPGERSVWFFYYFCLKRNYDVWKSKSPCFRCSLRFTSYKDCALKVKKKISILYLTSIEIIFTSYNFIYVVLITIEPKTSFILKLRPL